MAKIAKVFDKVAMETADLSQEGDVKLSLKDIDNFTRAEYNHYGWAKVNDVLNDTELARFRSLLSDQQNGTRPDRTADGYRLYDVGTKDNINNVVIVSDGKYRKPSIERVYRIGLETETLIEKERDFIHYAEKEFGAEARGLTYGDYGNELVAVHTPDDFPTYSEVRAGRSRGEGSGSGKVAGDRQFQRNRGNNSGTGEGSGLKFSAKDPVERKGTLLAIHNLTDEKLRKFLALGGAPMPSIAVTRSDVEHSNFGDISLIFDKSKLSLLN